MHVRVPHRRVGEKDQVITPMRRIIFVIAAVALGIGGLAEPPHLAGAAPYQGGAAISVSDRTPAPGGLVEIRCDGFRANSNVDIFFRSTPILLASVLADANGSVAASVKIPTEATGVHTIEVVGIGSDSGPLTRAVTVTVLTGSGGDVPQAESPASSTSDLASTGWTVDSAIIAAVVAIALGLALVWRARTKRRASRA